MLPNNFTLNQPWWLLLLLVIPFLIFWNSAKPSSALPLNKMATGNNKLPFKIWCLKFLPILNYIALALLIFAMARPQIINMFTTNNGNGIDIMMSIDISGSMLAEDFIPNRLEATKKVAKEFVQMRPNDRLGLTIFSGESFLQCPVTGNHPIMDKQISNLECGMLADGTAIGMGLATAVDHLQTSNAKSKIVILLTDGVNNSGLIDPKTALEIAKSLKVKVYCIGVGTNGNARIPVGKDPFDNWIFSDEKVEIDEALLQQIAKETGGNYYRATQNSDLKNIYKEIDKLEKSKVQIKSQQQIKELYYPFIFYGFILLLVAFISKYTWLRVFPLED